MRTITDLTRTLKRANPSKLRRRIRGIDPESRTVSLEVAAASMPDPGPYADLFLGHDGRRVHKWTHYMAAYDREFGPYRDGLPRPDGTNRPVRLLEIGVQHGGSLQLWRKFFGPDAEIWGVDVDPRCSAVDDPDLHVRIGSQDDPAFLRAVVGEMGGVDIVLDDGSHVAAHQRISYDTLFPLLSDGGLYVVEDTHTAYWRDFGGGYRARQSFVEHAKRLVDDMHAAYHYKKPVTPETPAAEWIPSITFYDSMVFIRKAARARPAVTRAGRESF